MDTQAIETAVTTLATEAKNADKSGDALHYSQAALNLAHVLATLHNKDKS